MSDAQVAVVPTEGEAEVICSLLRSEGIRCFYRGGINTALVGASTPFHWIEIRVNDESDLERARELVETPA